MRSLGCSPAAHFLTVRQRATVSRVTRPSILLVAFIAACASQRPPQVDDVIGCYEVIGTSQLTDTDSSLVHLIPDTFALLPEVLAVVNLQAGPVTVRRVVPESGKGTWTELSSWKIFGDSVFVRWPGSFHFSTYLAFTQVEGTRLTAMLSRRTDCVGCRPEPRQRVVLTRVPCGDSAARDTASVEW